MLSSWNENSFVDLVLVGCGHVLFGDVTVTVDCERVCVLGCYVSYISGKC